VEYFLQTKAWEDFQKSLGRHVHRQSGPGWSFLAIEEKNPAGKVLYAPYGPVAESVEAFDAALVALRALAKSCGAVFIRIEPVTAGLDPEGAPEALRSRGLQPAPVNQQPELSWIVDLDRDFKEVLAEMKPVNRNLYRNIHKKGVTFRSTQDPEDIRVLLNFLHMTARRNGFKPQSDEYLTQVAQSLGQRAQPPCSSRTCTAARWRQRWPMIRRTPGRTPTRPWTTPTASSARAFPSW
jgi:lipid II:glycine glycyltransferase (peptidoglycan interpeptide bridge formation enzyme)